MVRFRDVLAIIFFLIWIPLGLLLLGGVMWMIVVNPLKIMQDTFSGEMGPFGPGGGMPSKEMMEEMMDRERPPAGFEDFESLRR